MWLSTNWSPLRSIRVLTVQVWRVSALVPRSLGIGSWLWLIEIRISVLRIPTWRWRAWVILLIELVLSKPWRSRRLQAVLRNVVIGGSWANRIIAQSRWNSSSDNRTTKVLWLSTMTTEGVWADTLSLELLLVAKVVGVHGLLLLTVGGGLAFALAALLEADEDECEDQDESDTTADGPNGNLGVLWKAVELLGDGKLLRLWAGGKGFLLSGNSSVYCYYLFCLIPTRGLLTDER